MKDRVKINLDELKKLDRPVTENDFTPTEFDVDFDYNFLHYMLTTDMRIITHSGQFHADEIFSIALILIARCAIKNESRDPDKAIRPTMQTVRYSVERTSTVSTEDVDLYRYNLILDLKNGHFDHHHDDQNKRWYSDAPRFNYAPNHPKRDMNALATFGALWSKIGHIFDVPGVIGRNVYDDLYNSFIRDIDQLDNCGPKVAKSPISKMISNMNGWDSYEFSRVYYPDPMSDLPYNFIEAVLFAVRILHAEIAQWQNIYNGVALITKECEQTTINGSKYVIVPKAKDGEPELKIPLNSAEVIGAAVLVNMNPNPRDGAFRMVMVDSTKVCLDQQVFDNKDKIPGMVFIHPARFIATFDTVEHLQEFMNHCKLVDGLDGSTIVWSENVE